MFCLTKASPNYNGSDIVSKDIKGTIGLHIVPSILWAVWALLGTHGPEVLHNSQRQGGYCCLQGQAST